MSLNEIFDLKLVKSIECTMTSLAFEHAIRVYINKPQVVNKWLAGSINLDANDESLDKEILTSTKNKIECAFEIKEFIPKNRKIFTGLKYLVAIGEQMVLFTPIEKSGSLKKFPSIKLCHLFEYSQGKINIYVDQNCIDQTESVEEKEKLEFQVKWLTDTLLPKLKSWCMNIKTDENMSCTQLATLKLYPNMINDYSTLYQKLKDIYWPRFSVKWHEITGTNPEKFIHEDISIATYFILVWRHYDYKVTRFVDIGCGNGLLVYILNDQGYNGFGIDMRKRKIWTNEFYESVGINLVEKTIDPQVDTFENCDWLIGNHSDELSPWLPIIASKSSKKDNLSCNFLLIPCCFFDFHTRFDVKKKNEARYDTYLNYLEKICKLSEFEVHRDKLRIPSTRNVCIIGLMQTIVHKPVYNLNPKDQEFKTKIMNIINNIEDSFKTEFKPRDLANENLKSSRNCTKTVDNELKSFIIKRVLANLLANESDKSECVFIKKYNGQKWNAGKIMRMGQIAGLFDKETMSKLKLECGGIKTLLKNYHQLFTTFDHDKVKLKIWTAVDRDHELFNDSEQSAAKIPKMSKIEQYTRDNKVNETAPRLKTKRCLFDSMHPDGCLLREKECDFIHIPQESLNE